MENARKSTVTDTMVERFEGLSAKHLLEWAASRDGRQNDCFEELHFHLERLLMWISLESLLHPERKLVPRRMSTLRRRTNWLDQEVSSDLMR